MALIEIDDVFQVEEAKAQINNNETVILVTCVFRPPSLMFILLYVIVIEDRFHYFYTAYISVTLFLSHFR